MLVEQVKELGGAIHIFSSLHVSGERKWNNFIGTFNR
jgi:stalled ribosome rescue protein Dom34